MKRFNYIKIATKSSVSIAIYNRNFKIIFVYRAGGRSRTLSVAQIKPNEIDPNNETD